VGLQRTAARLFWTSPSPRIQAASLARLAAAAETQGDLEGAIYNLRLIMDRYPGARDITGVPLGPSSGLLLARLLERANHRLEARATVMGLLSDLTFARYTISPVELSYYMGEVRRLAARIEQDPLIPAADRDQVNRLLNSPFPRLYQRYRAGVGMREVEGRVDHFGGKEYVHFDRRIGERIVLVLAPADEIQSIFAAALGPGFREGYQVFLSGEIPANSADRFEKVLQLEVPYLGSGVTLSRDKTQTSTLARARQTFLSALVSLALVMFFLGGFLIARDIKRHLEVAHLKAEFIANVSHELKTPLTTIRMFAETLFHGRCRKESERDYLHRILIQSDHLTMLIDNILQLSRADEVVLEQRRSERDLKGLVHEAWDQMRIRWDDRSVAVNVPEGINFFCDANLMLLAIGNLLDNAAKYGNPTEPIQVTAGLDRRNIWISVADKGMGIPAQEQAKIFNRFYRATNASARSGMGLGLFLVQKIADLHGGKVDFQSREGEGSTFTLRVPARAR
jgi:two-component system phosphate regulon sensor histidine kinase PhoR